MTKFKYVCPDCGSDDIGWDATASWSVALQDWVLSSAGESDAWCRDCGEEVDAIEEPLDPLVEATRAVLAHGDKT